MLVNRRDVAGVEEAFIVEDGVVDFEIGFGDRGAGDLEAAKSLAVPRSSLPASSVIFISTPNGG